LADRIRILGIDPGSRITGYGILESCGSTSRYIVSGCIRTGSADFTERLNEIYTRVRALVAEYEPQQLAIEKVFVHRNADSALKLGQARAAAICGTFGGKLELFEYAARAIKQAVVGRGAADKEQVQHMVKAILMLNELPSPDEADALATAICHAHSYPLNNALLSGKQGVKSRSSRPTRSSLRSAWRRTAG
jgi:crossover junction endodeoxyribonuclease RuvC